MSVPSTSWLVSESSAATSPASTVGRCNRRALSMDCETSARIVNDAVKKMITANMTSNSVNAPRAGIIFAV